MAPPLPSGLTRLPCVTNRWIVFSAMACRWTNRNSLHVKVAKKSRDILSKNACNSFMYKEQ